MKHPIRTVLILIGLLVIAAVVLYLNGVDPAYVWSLFALSAVGIGTSTAKMQQSASEKKEDDQIKTDGATVAQQIVDRPVQADIATLSSDTQQQVTDIKQNTTKKILDRVKQHGQGST